MNLEFIRKTAEENGVKLTVTELADGSIKVTATRGVNGYTIYLHDDELMEHHDWSCATAHDRRYGNPINNRNKDINDSRRDATTKFIKWLKPTDQ